MNGNDSPSDWNGLDKAMRGLIRTARQGQIVAALAIVTMMPALSLSSAQEGVGRSALVIDDGYALILDSIFAYKRVPSLKVAYTMVLRFEPNQRPEFQLLFRVWHDGHTEASLFMVKSGSAWDLANAYISKTGKENIAAIVSLIPVEKKQLEVDPTKVERWHAGLFDSLRASDSQLQRAAPEYTKNGSRIAVLDGTRYEFWYSQGETELRWTFSDIDVNDRPSRANLALTRWMNGVRVAFLKKQ